MPGPGGRVLLDISTAPTVRAPSVPTDGSPAEADPVEIDDLISQLQRGARKG